VVEANWPEKMVAREGAQNTPAVWALVKLTPRLAKRSILGVMAAGVVLWHPIQSFMSSTARNKTLGLLAISAGQTDKAAANQIAATADVGEAFFILMVFP
jgi:hypothetical protein